MPTDPKPEKEKTLGSDMSVLDTLLSEELRLVKKYLLDSSGKLKLYHPITQRCFFRILQGQPVNLLEELREYARIQKEKKK